MTEVVESANTTAQQGISAPVVIGILIVAVVAIAIVMSSRKKKR